MRKTMDHKAYPKALRGKTVDQLKFIATDAAEAARVNPDGENASYYLDEVAYVSNELNRRESAKRSK